MTSLITRFLQWIGGKIPWHSVADLLRQLARRRKWVLIVTVAFLLSAVGLGYVYWIRSTTYEGVVRDALKRECMPTPQIYKGLEAFIVSSMPDNVEDSFLKRDLNPQFYKELQSIATQVQNADLKKTPDLEVFPGNGGIVLTDKVEGGFLFLPIQVLRPTFTEEQRQLFVLRDTASLEGRRALITKTLENDPELEREIAFTAALAPALQRLATTTVTTDTQDKPKQVYVITKSGLNRIINGNANARSAYQFPETTFFPSRPYFWPVFDPMNPHFARTLEEIAPAGKNIKLQDLFTVSKPYMDLGGNGLVVTIARGILVDGCPRAVLCIDLPVHTETTLYDRVRERVNSLGGYSVEVACSVSDNPRCAPIDPTTARQSVNDPLVRHMVETLQDRLVRQKRADILGNIIVLNSNSTTPNDIVEASLPFGVEDTANERFLLISMDLVRYRRLTTGLGLTAATLIGLTTLLLAYVSGMHAKQSHDYEAAFKRVAEVMVESPTPYIRLDSNDKIRDFSGSFLDLIGWDPEKAQKLSSTKFRSLLADEESRQTYDDVESRRRKDDDVEPYHVKLRRVDGSAKSVKIVSAAVPDSQGGEMPETFGLLLGPADENVVPVDFVAAAKRSVGD
jgi:PAS domain S-box-containing protein